MISGSAALSGTTSTRDQLEFVGSLITGATINGLYNVFVDGRYMDDTMAQKLVSTYGYNVTTNYSDMGTFPTYKISWEPLPSGPKQPQESIMILGTLPSGTTYAYTIMNFKTKTIIGPVDTGISKDDYYVEWFSILNEAGYVIKFHPNSSNPMIHYFVGSDGETFEPVSGSTNYWADNIDTIYYYYYDNNTGIITFFNGKVVTTLTLGPNEYFDYQWNDYGCTYDGSFQFYIFNNVTNIKYDKLITSGGTINTFLITDYNTYYNETYVYGKYVLDIRMLQSNDVRTELNWYTSDGTLVRNLDVSSGNYTYYNYNSYALDKFALILTTNDNNDPYKIISYDAAKDILVQDTHERGNNYPYFGNYDVNRNMWDHNHYRLDGLYIMFYNDDNGSWYNDLYSYIYLDIYYLEDGETSGSVFVFNDTGLPNKALSPYNTTQSQYLSFFVDEGDSILKRLILKKSGNIKYTLGALSNFSDWGWTNSSNLYHHFKTRENGTDIYTEYAMKNDGTIYSKTFGTNYVSTYHYYDVSVIYDGNEAYYINNNSNGWQPLDFGDPWIWSTNWYYNDDFLMKSDVMSFNYYEGSGTTITKNSVGQITFPNNNGYWDIEMGKDYILYVYQDYNTNNLKYILYNYNGTIIETKDTGVQSWAEGYAGLEDRYFISYYTDTNKITHQMIVPNKNIDTVDLMNTYVYNVEFDDLVWWD